jgi:pyrimidine operon attenuation protein / uracil phosphoribosyltransferase
VLFANFALPVIAETFMPTLSRQILSPTQIRQKIRRIAFQVYENNVDESAFVLAGVSGEGLAFAWQLADELGRIAAQPVEVIELVLDKKLSTLPPLTLPANAPTDFSDKIVIVVDDVLYTGRTLLFALQPFLSVPLRKLQVAVLIDRNHPRYPVAADYKGYELSTTLTEHVEVVLSDNNRTGVYLR